ncbi:hypothetical protein GCM10018965_079010 [Nonomuraea roseola]
MACTRCTVDGDSALPVPITPLSQAGEEAAQIGRSQLRDQDPAQARDQVNPHMVGITLPSTLADRLEGSQPVAQPLRHGARCTHPTRNISGGEFPDSSHGVLCGAEAAPPRPHFTSVQAYYLNRVVPRTVTFVGQVGTRPVLA